jgi:hypothetical protein
MLEAKIDQLKQSIDRLIEVISATNCTAAPAAPSNLARKPEQPTTTAVGASDADGANTAAVPYEKVRDAVVSLSSTKGRDAAVAVLNGLGVKNAKELKPEQYPAALDALTKAAA